MTTILAGAACWSGWAAAQPVGVGACDNFLAAYSQCAASPTIPAEARGPIQQGIEGMRASFRSAASQGGAARETIRQQCTSSHEMVRTRMIEAFKCEFPAAAAMPVAADTAVDAPTPTARAAPAAADPAVLTARKADAYTKVQNDIVEWNPIGRQLAEHISNNERVLKLGTKLGANAWYLFGISDFDNRIAALQEAVALPGSVPEADAQAATLLAALKAVNPVIKELDRYQKMRDFKEDGFKLAKEREKPLEDGMRAAAGASEAFSTALFERRMGIDEKRLSGMTAGSLPHGLLGASLKTRLLLRRYDALEKPGDVPPFLTALDEVRASNKALLGIADGLSPKANSYCASYSEALDALIGHGKDLASTVKAKQSPETASKSFATDYNNSVDYYAKCLRDEPRARG